MYVLREMYVYCAIVSDPGHFNSELHFAKWTPEIKIEAQPYRNILNGK